MILIGRKRLTEFLTRHPDARPWLNAWTAEIASADWKGPQDIKERYRSASFLPSNTVVFNVKGNQFRMEVQVAYKTGRVVVKRIGTHSQYTRWRR